MLICFDFFYSHFSLYTSDGIDFESLVGIKLTLFSINLVISTVCCGFLLGLAYIHLLKNCRS